ncbi:cysteine proteinase [Aspergillus steynii IBT 23096]|uniref:Cysteine proteinase n=1 Tax=Aspergillus steynii IBT 23096 TaxID=1392250 RepID=A0A2I2GEA1_9EURO|nr:cysteine proteinase [Aspergillus steynii IBT 23096]PLB51215.1 cysteine proteinase [Aspergillus steynii IBT 23096]
MSPEADKDPKKSPQEHINDFWTKFITKTPSKVTRIFPIDLHADILPPAEEEPVLSSRNVAEGYEATAEKCRQRIRRIVRDCNRTNEKFVDPDFDLETDRYLNLWNCLRGLARNEDTKPADENESVDEEEEGSGFPGSVHRVDWIFERPEFTIDGYSSTDIKQGANGDCWWLAAVATICNRRDLMDRLCVAQDPECGVYGFVFYRDGEWVSTVIDDNLYLTNEDFDFNGDWHGSVGKKAREHRRNHQTGSEALYFAKCSHQNETWLPLLEKAYAKIHGDYDALWGGWSGEAVEDMTGGVTTTIATNRILKKSMLWKELVDPEGGFVFAASALAAGRDSARGGLAMGHAYSIIRATEQQDEDGNPVRLVLIRNPWGERNEKGTGEWNGPWSDGSREWTPYWLEKLQHKFGDDGIFWITYEDMLSTFAFLHRTRIFDKKWTIVQRWTSVSVPWVTGFLQTKFDVDVKKAGPVVFVLSQIDKRYFRALEGQYEFALHFILREKNAKPGEHLGLVRPVHSWEDRSISAEFELEPGRYEVVPKIIATRDPKKKMVEDVVKAQVEKNSQKLRQIGLNYDLANSKHELKGQMEAKADKENKEQKVEQEKKHDEDGSQIEKLEKGDLASSTDQDVNGKEAHDADGQIVGQVDALTLHGTSDVEQNDREDKKDDDKGKENNKEEEHAKDETQAPETDDNGPGPWNAVCVIGLRVYTQDPEVTIELEKAKDSNVV